MGLNPFYFLWHFLFQMHLVLSPEDRALGYTVTGYLGRAQLLHLSSNELHLSATKGSVNSQIPELNNPDTYFGSLCPPLKIFLRTDGDEKLRRVPQCG